MNATALTVFQSTTGLDARDLFGTKERRRDAAVERLMTLEYDEVAEQLIAHYKSIERPSVGANEVVPRLYDSEFKYSSKPLSGIPPPRRGASPHHIWNALLYCHRIETSDPLVAGVAWALRRWYPFGLLLLNGLEFWLQVEDLARDGIVLVTAFEEPEFEPPDVRTLFRAATKNRDFRKFVHDLVPYLADHRSAKSLAKAMDLDISTWDSYESDLWRFLQEMSYGGGTDPWFPSRGHLALLRALASTEAATPRFELNTEFLFELAELRLPDSTAVEAEDICSIRRSSEIFEGWRAGLERAYAELARSLDMGRPPDAARAAAVAVLEDSAAVLLDQMKKEGSKVWTGALRGLVLGGAAATPGVIASRSASAAGMTAGLGGLIGFLGNVLWGKTERRASENAASALVAHLTAFGGQHAPD